MNMVIITTLIIATSVRHAVSFAFVHEAAKICIPDSQFFYNHNNCKCDSEGTGIVCQQGVYSSVTPLLDRRQLQNVTLDCVPNRIFEFPCHKCLCDESGKYGTCVRHNCDDYNFTSESQKLCVPGSIFTVDTCNGCICGDDGKAACTRLDCAIDIKNMPECVPNTSNFRLQCNYCSCSSEGKAICFRMGCSPIEFQHENLLNITTMCEAKSIFDYNCHECVCGDGGNYALCYGKTCSISNFDRTKDTKEKCSPGMIFGDRCNVCVCGSDGKGACTKLNCDIDYRFEY